MDENGVSLEVLKELDKLGEISGTDSYFLYHMYLGMKDWTNEQQQMYIDGKHEELNKSLNIKCNFKYNIQNS